MYLGVTNSSTTVVNNTIVKNGNEPSDVLNRFNPYYYKPKSNNDYYRYYKDVQRVDRNEEQKSIYQNFFSVKRDITLKRKAQLILCLALVPMFFAILFYFLTYINEDITVFVFLTWMSVLASFCIAGVSFYYYLKFKSGFNKPPKNLMSNEEYMSLVKKKINDMNVEHIAIEKLGLDLDQLTDINRIIVQDIVLADHSLVYFDRDTKKLYSSTQYIKFFFFTTERIYTYYLEFDMCCDKQIERTHEIFYVDICDVSSQSKKSSIYLTKKFKIDVDVCQFSVYTLKSDIKFVINGDSENVKYLDKIRYKIRQKTFKA